MYGIVGPGIELKIADEIEGFTLDDGFEGADVSLVFGGGIEVARIIVEGRYEKGLRRINKNFSDFDRNQEAVVHDSVRTAIQIAGGLFRSSAASPPGSTGAANKGSSARQNTSPTSR